MTELERADWPRQARLLFLVAMAMFVITVGIGIVNGLDLVDFSTGELRNTVLTHVHSGTLGWITLAILAATMWLGRAGGRRLTLAFAVLIPAYVAAFWWGNLAARAITGTLLLLAVLWALLWAWRLALRVPTFPRLAVALGLTTFAIGAIVGVLIQIERALATSIFPAGADPAGAHASTMVFSYLVLVAMGLLEWQILGTPGRPRGAVIQAGALFLGGLLLVTALLFLGDSATQPVGAIYLLLELVAVVLFVVRVLPAAARTSWLAAGPRRHFATAAVFVVVAMALFMSFVFALITSPTPDDFASLPTGVLGASDHATFIGVMTNLTFALILKLTADRRDIARWADQVTYWLMNVGLVLFLVGLVGDSAELKRLGAPAMGVGILIGLAALAMRLRASDFRAGATDYADGPEVAPASA